MNVVQVLLHVLHNQPTDVAGGLLLVSSVQMFPQMDSALEDFPTNMTGGFLAVLSVIMVEQSTVRVEGSAASVTRNLNFLGNFLRVWSTYVSTLIEVNRDFVTSSALLMAKMYNSIMFGLLLIGLKHHATMALQVILSGHHGDMVRIGKILRFYRNILLDLNNSGDGLIFIRAKVRTGNDFLHVKVHTKVVTVFFNLCFFFIENGTDFIISYLVVKFLVIGRCGFQ